MRILLPLIILFCASLAQAEETHYNWIDFTSEASRTIDNDLLVAQLSVEVNDHSPARVAQLLNTTLNESLQQAAGFPAVKASSTGHSTMPIYGKSNHLDGWRGNAKIRLESRDFKAAGELIGQLQEKMQLTGINFTVAAESRRRLEEELVGEGLAAFRKQAEAVRAALGGDGYRIVRLNINHGGYRPQPLFLDNIGLTRQAAAAPAPEFAGGESELNVQVNGTIEITYPATPAATTEKAW